MNFERFDGMRKILIGDLMTITEDRRINEPDWHVAELRRFWLAACERAVLADLKQPTWKDMERCDRLAAGHVDWFTKLPLYVCEIMFGVRTAA